MNKLRENAIVVNDLPLGLVKIDGEPHSFVQIDNPVWFGSIGSGHSLNRYAGQPCCVLSKNAGFARLMRLRLESRGDQIPI